MLLSPIIIIIIVIMATIVVGQIVPLWTCRQIQSRLNWEFLKAFITSALEFIN